MKSLVIALSLLSFTQVAPAATEELDGLKFCRVVKRDGSFGQPKTTAKHCLSFADGIATDNASTFFGRPPKKYPYTLKKDMIIDTKTKKSTGYQLLEDGNLNMVENDIVLDRQ